jgi:anti-sigma regulatory factor (Ser/Thr protein kinase)
MRKGGDRMVQRGPAADIVPARPIRRRGLPVAGRPGAAGTQAPPLFDRGTSMARAWPLRSFLELGPYPEAVPCARLHAKAVLWEWGRTLLAQQVELLVSELVTNAVQASWPMRTLSAVRMWLLSDKEKVLILVWDASPHPPAPSHHTAGEIHENGHGLMLVEAISDQWSWYAVRETGGKVVWALCTDTRAGT